MMVVPPLKQFKVTFCDVVEAETIEDAYNIVLLMCRGCAEANDITPFAFEDLGC